jgi:hypothetical protein
MFDSYFLFSIKFVQCCTFNLLFTHVSDPPPPLSVLAINLPVAINMEFSFRV